VTPAWLRPRAEVDLVERSRYYLNRAGHDVATQFFGAAMGALHAVERMPGTGSPRIGELCDIPGLRVRGIEGFPCGWYCFVRPDHVDVVRLLADSQDLASILDAAVDDE
jgi:toxin ParE1/3/4